MRSQNSSIGAPSSSEGVAWVCRRWYPDSGGSHSGGTSSLTRKTGFDHADSSVAIGSVYFIDRLRDATVLSSCGGLGGLWRNARRTASVKGNVQDRTSRMPRFRPAPVSSLASVILATLLPTLTACSSKSVDPTLLLTNLTGGPIDVDVYDYTPDVKIKGIVFSPDYSIGTVTSTLCVSLARVPVGDQFLVEAVDSPQGEQWFGQLFVPDDASGWTITFDPYPTQPGGPAQATTACSPVQDTATFVGPEAARRD